MRSLADIGIVRFGIRSFLGARLWAAELLEQFMKSPRLK